MTPNDYKLDFIGRTLTLDYKQQENPRSEVWVPLLT